MKTIYPRPLTWIFLVSFLFNAEISPKQTSISFARSRKKCPRRCSLNCIYASSSKLAPTDEFLLLLAAADQTKFRESSLLDLWKLQLETRNTLSIKIFSFRNSTETTTTQLRDRGDAWTFKGNSWNTEIRNYHGVFPLKYWPEWNVYRVVTCANRSTGLSLTLQIVTRIDIASWKIKIADLIFLLRSFTWACQLFFTVFETFENLERS